MDAQNDINFAKRGEQYVKLRDKIKELNDEHKKRMQPYTETLEKLNTMILAHLNAVGTDSAAIKGIGTAYKNLKVSATLADPAEFRRFVIGGEHWDLVDWSANKTAVQTFVDEHQGPPPGVNFTTTYVAGVRRG